LDLNQRSLCGFRGRKVENAVPNSDAILVRSRTVLFADSALHYQPEDKKTAVPVAHALKIATPRSLSTGAKKESACPEQKGSVDRLVKGAGLGRSLGALNQPVGKAFGVV
jgi:hypothetical protein